jgi:A/G-specific adenine glycosylase
VEDKTVFILSCRNAYALIKRPDSGLLAGLWQFPEAEGFLDAQQALSAIEKMGLRPLQIYRQAERTHIFTHVQWNMRGFYVEVDKPEGQFSWYSAEEIEKEAALPTAYRQFYN